MEDRTLKDREEVMALREKIRDTISLYRSFPQVNNEVPSAILEETASLEQTGLDGIKAIGIKVPDYFNCSILVVDMKEGEIRPPHINVENISIEVVRGSIELTIEDSVSIMNTGDKALIPKRSLVSMVAIRRSLLVKVFEPSLPEIEEEEEDTQNE